MRTSLFARILMGVIWLYRKAIGPLFPPSCRFYPSCSAYAIEALRFHGAARGSYLALRRISRCHPWHEGGVDHVPPATRGMHR